MDSKKLMASELLAQLLEDNTSFMDFIEDSIKQLLRSKKPFLICSSKDVPSIVVQIDEVGIWIAFLSELQGS